MSQSSSSLILVISTVESREDADRLAAELVRQSLAACVQIDGPIESHYRWAEQLHKATEYRLMIKSQAAVWPRLHTALDKLHPYDEPEIIMIPVSDAAEGYRQWVVDQTS